MVHLVVPMVRVQVRSDVVLPRRPVATEVARKWFLSRMCQ